jgi:hypothetical protein
MPKTNPWVLCRTGNRSWHALLCGWARRELSHTQRSERGKNQQRESCDQAEKSIGRGGRWSDRGRRTPLRWRAGKWCIAPVKTRTCPVVCVLYRKDKSSQRENWDPQAPWAHGWRKSRTKTRCGDTTAARWIWAAWRWKREIHERNPVVKYTREPKTCRQNWRQRLDLAQSKRGKQAAQQDTNNWFSIAINNIYNRSTEVTVLPRSFN